MGAGRGSLKAGRRIRAVLLLVLLIIALGIGGAAALQRWPRKPERDPGRLDLLSASLAEFNAARYEQALALLDRRASEVKPTSLDWMLRARVAEAQGRTEEALAHLKHIPDSDPIAAQAWLKAGQIEMVQHRARAAEAAYQRALALNPEQVQSHRELAYIYALQRRKAECDAQFGHLAKLISMDYVLAFAWGQNDCEIWDPQESLRALVPIVDTDPSDRWSRLALAKNYRKTNQFDEAEAALGPLPESDSDARAIRVEIALDRGDVDAAEALVRDVSADHPRLNTLRGRLALHANDPNQAVGSFRAALRRSPRDRDAMHGLGIALQRLGDPHAKELLRRAARHDELRRIIVACGNSQRIDLKAFAHLGDICESLGRPDQARVWYHVAIGWDPLDSQAHQGLARLDRAAPERTAETIP